jgi:hypothetical protein
MLMPPQDPRRPTDLRADAEPHAGAMLAESTGPGRLPPRQWPAPQAACLRPAKGARRTVPYGAQTDAATGATIDSYGLAPDVNPHDDIQP